MRAAFTPKRELKKILRKAIESNGKTYVVYNYPWEKRKPKTFTVNGQTLRVKPICFTGAAKIVLEVAKQVFGELTYAGGTFREETYTNDKGMVHLFPTGSAGLFEFTITKLS